VGRRHPYREYLDSVKQKLTSMGFVEMVGNLVETEFWNMDALYMPQFHPAREIQDVYMVENPSQATTLHPQTSANVAAAHRDGGGTGSTGWKYQFDLERTKQLILRSHGTALSARTLGSGPDVPSKFFSVARCFRCDTVDATHSADFFQIEGIVLGEDINFRHLLGLLRLFGYEVAKAESCRFVPAYFPFTEPSVEVHMKHPTLGYVELGGAGIFRPELTKSLGIDVPVIAWGLGIDRMAMVALGIDDIRDLFHADLSRLREMRNL
jgi:phenylalanyl-tRNA synthetase alpha chain